jgi:hypothetical protein
MLSLYVIGAVHEIGSAQTTATTGKLNISFRIKDLGYNFIFIITVSLYHSMYIISFCTFFHTLAVEL